MPSRAVITSFSYAVFSLVTDEPRALSVPVGVALWSPQRKWVKLRLVEPGERLLGFNPTEHFPFVDLVREKIEHWIETGKLPYSEAELHPWQDEWWRHVRQLLIHRVQLSEPLSIDCRDPDSEIDVLYESVVAPHRHTTESKARIEAVIGTSLGQLAKEFKGRQQLPGFGGRNVSVQRLYRGQKRDVVVEGVNLAGANPDQHVDALVSKLMRLLEGLNKKCTFLVGYLASPHGLNGEAPLVEWLERKTTAKTFNLKTQREDFHEAARESVRTAGRQLTMSEHDCQ